MEYYEHGLKIDVSKEAYDKDILLEHPEKNRIEINGITGSIDLSLELADSDKLEELCLSGEGFYEPPANLEKLTNLRKLTLRSFCDMTKLPELPHLEELSFVACHIERDIKILLQKVPHLKKLTIWGYHGQGFDCLSDEVKGAFSIGELPEDIGALQELEDLALYSTKITTLPGSFKELKLLKTLRVMEERMREFPLVLGELSWLEELHFNCEIKTIPGNFINLRSLRKLNMDKAFNKGVWDLHNSHNSFYLHPLTDLIGKLPSLESLSLNSCGVENIEFLRDAGNLKEFSCDHSRLENCEGFIELKKLETLNLSSANILESIDGLSGLPLKKLDLEGCFSLESIEVISQLNDLESINISGCDQLDDLKPLYAHPTLERENADDDVEKWEMRVNLKDIPTLDSVLEKVKSEDLVLFEEALVHLKKHVDLNCHDETNPLAGFFGEEEDEYEIVHLKILDEGFEFHRQELSSESLVLLVDISLRSAGLDNYEITLLAIREIIRRKDELAQVKVVEIFRKACRYYGYRYRENTVLDQLYDDLFPDFETEALIRLLNEGHGDMLNCNGGDGGDRCYVPAFKRIKRGEQFEKLLELFFAYRDKYIHYSDFGNPYFSSLQKSILKVLPAKKKSRFKDNVDRRMPEAELVQMVESRDLDDKIWLLEELDNMDETFLKKNYYEVITSLNDFDLPEESWERGLGFFIEWKPGKGRCVVEYIDSINISCDTKSKIVMNLIEKMDYKCEPMDRIHPLREYAAMYMGGLNEVYTEEMSRMRSICKNYRMDYDLRDRRIERLRELAQKIAKPVSFTNGNLGYDLIDLVDSDGSKRSWAQFTEICKAYFSVMEREVVSRMYALHYLAAGVCFIDDRGALRWLESFLPHDITHDLLAFNLACAYSHFGEKGMMLKFIKRSLELGKTSQEFMDDEDFSFFWKDEDFLDLLKV
ncbi:MAG: leucine-rich repeat domain-containing protein [Spirochaetales bacterium]|nr:leucine-rich repeat domain-containing protein [Spirochaetales bacterium]